MALCATIRSSGKPEFLASATHLRPPGSASPSFLSVLRWMVDVFFNRPTRFFEVLDRGYWRCTALAPGKRS